MTAEPRYSASKPLLPDTDAIYPYLKRIDRNRYYTNFGPLVEEAHDRLSAWLGVGRDCVMTASSGMSILEILIQAYDIPKGSTAIVPSWTYIATPHAALNRGLIPFFSDVDRKSWALTPEIAEKALAQAPGKVSLVMPVAPFGDPLPVREWEDFSCRHNVRVIIDGAALSLDDVVPSETVPTMISFHATKMLNAGEGGLSVVKDADITRRVKEMSHFGTGKEGIFLNGTNAKMSEYHAAVLLASIDQWPQTKAAYQHIARRFYKNLSASNAVTLRPEYGTKRFNATCMIEYERLDTNALLVDGIETRRWWRRACHNEPLFSAIAHTDLSVTDYLADHTIGLPVHKDYSDADIDYVCGQVLKHSA